MAREHKAQEIARLSARPPVNSDRTLPENADALRAELHFSASMVNNPVSATACGEVVPSHLVTRDYPEEVDCPACRESTAFKFRQE